MPQGMLPGRPHTLLEAALPLTFSTLSLPASDSRSLVLTLTYFVMLLSILAQGLTLGWIDRKVSM